MSGDGTRSRSCLSDPVRAKQSSAAAAAAVAATAAAAAAAFTSNGRVVVRGAGQRHLPRCCCCAAAAAVVVVAVACHGLACAPNGLRCARACVLARAQVAALQTTAVPAEAAW
eukprot:COSAG01_NODE_3693_length_5788_cov_7.398137_7_plen_113_part_00